MFCSLAFNFKHGADSLQHIVGCGALNWQICSFYILSNPFIGFCALPLQIFVEIIKRSGRELFQTNETSIFLFFFSVYDLFVVQSLCISQKVRKSGHYGAYTETMIYNLMKLGTDWSYQTMNLMKSDHQGKDQWVTEGRKLNLLVD